MPQLNWLTREHDIQAATAVPHRVLQEVANLSYGEPSENLLVQGDNLEALKALLPFYAGRVKCIYIDPPYNTGSAFAHYDDGLEHSKWISMMLPRISLLREFLREDGSIWLSVDDNESHYLKVIMDEVFGRKNFVTNVIWRKNFSPKSSARHFSEDHDHILVYAKNGTKWLPNLLPRTEKQNSIYKNPDNDPRGPWTSGDLSARNYYSEGTYAIDTPNGNRIPAPPNGRYWAVSKKKLLELDNDNRIYWTAGGSGVPRLKRFLSEVKAGRVPQTIWPFEDVGHTQGAKKEIVKIFGGDIFDTPKPEALIRRVLHISTNPGDLVLDSFLGSGTTAAVAHKMGRRWIGIEMGDHAQTHCALRLQKVIDGEQGGISKDVGWKKGGGFRFCNLGPTVFNEFGRINPEVSFEDLARHIWFAENQAPLSSQTLGTAIGVAEGKGYALLFNGILKDRSPVGGNVLTSATLRLIRQDIERLSPGFEGEIVVYATATRIGDDRARAERITFKQTPYDISVRG